ncbi:acetyltransferase [Bacillus sp. Soil768D1]|nr:acetyltransferase [Bacillus sp. Soil768D1]
MKKLIKKILYKINGRPDVEKLTSFGLEMGENVHIGPHVIIDDSHCWLISIGDECTLAPRVHILAHDASTKKHLGYTKIGRVSIGEKTFIGAGSIILPGVKIGENVIIGAGSVVSKDIPDNSVAVGNPASVVDETQNYINRQKNKMDGAPIYPIKGWTLSGGITAENREKMKESLKDKMGFVE